MSRKPHGKGKAYFGDGSFYQGYFFNGKMHGKGRLVHKTMWYEGNFHNDKYQGSFFQGKRNGFGKEWMDS